MTHEVHYNDYLEFNTISQHKNIWNYLYGNKYKLLFITNNKLSTNLLHKIHKRKIYAINPSVDQFIHSGYKYLKILLILNTSIVQQDKLQCVSTNVWIRNDFATQKSIETVMVDARRKLKPSSSYLKF